MRKTIQRSIILFIILVITISCGDYRKTNSGYTIKGESKIVFNELDNSLNEQCLISGFVYSKDMKEFLSQAQVKIGNHEYTTDKNGYFSAKVEAGKYTISTKYLGNNESTIKNLNAEKNHRIIVIFKLGTTAMY